MFRMILTGLAGWAISSSAMAGAFGIEMGTTAKDLKILKVLDRVGTSTLYMVEPPIRNAEFDLYLVTASDETGACTVHAFSPIFVGDTDGRQVKPGFEKIKAALSQKYGDAETTTLRTKSFGPGGRNFAATLYDNDDGIFTRWNFDLETSGDLKSITLSILPRSPTSTSMSLGYDFRNAEGCEITGDENSSDGL